jgi:hypothetical protein
MTRDGKIEVKWNDFSNVGAVLLDGLTFCGIEWSEKRQRFCIEDVCGQCLTHVESIKGQAESKDAALALAVDMVRDGRMPSPEQARAEHAERQRLAAPRLATAREKRARQPAQIRKRREKAELSQQWSDASTAQWEAETADKRAGPLYETLAEAFDFADAELWKSNSFAMLRPRLVIHVRARVAALEADLAYERTRSPTPFAMYASAERRKTAAERRKAETSSAIGKLEAKRARAREILAQLAPDDVKATP